MTPDNLVNKYNQFTAAIKAVKGSTNPHFKNKFANLDTWIQEIHTHAIQYGFMVTEIMSPLMANECIYQMHTCTLTHESGWSNSSSYVVCSVDEKPQAMGAATTYARRYNLQVLLNCTGEDDDDGNIANEQIKATPSTTVAMKRKLT